LKYLSAYLLLGFSFVPSNPNRLTGLKQTCEETTCKLRGSCLSSRFCFCRICLCWNVKFLCAVLSL